MKKIQFGLFAFTLLAFSIYDLTHDTPSTARKKKFEPKSQVIVKVNWK